jgi:dCMP deaminase
VAKQSDLDIAYLRTAYVIAELSQAKRKKVGAILVAAEGGIIAEGFNGTYSGADNNCETNYHSIMNIEGVLVCSNCHTVVDNQIGCTVLKTKPEVLHAETNAIAKIAKSTRSSAGSTLYTTLMPCFECSKLIIQAGIRRVVFSEYYPYKGFQGIERPVGLKLLEQANILVEQLDMSAADCHDYDRELEATESIVPDEIRPLV